MSPILLELVAPMLSCPEINSLRLGSRHRNACINEYPDDWKYAVSYLSEWIQELSHLYRHRIVIRVIDAMSPLGLWKQIRYRLFRFPAFIIDRKRTYIGWDYQELETLIDERIRNVGRSL